MSKRIITSESSRSDAYYRGHTKEGGRDRMHWGTGHFTPSQPEQEDDYNPNEFHTALERFIHKYGEDWRARYLTLEGCFAGDEDFEENEEAM
jgi:hypothetical protein